MVGSFGEVQVMDWGLAKVLKRGGRTDEPDSPEPTPPVSVIQTVRSRSDADASDAGTILGTPNYMSPEQARGEVDDVGCRSDVFALGSILCQVLTGQPAFTGRNTGEIQRKAARGDLADAFARLDARGADSDLIGLAKDCLAPEADDRPRDADAVAARITAYQAGVQELLRQSEIDRAKAESRAVEERKRRRWQLGLAAAVLVVMTLGGAALAAAQNRLVRADVLLDEAERLCEQAQRDPAGGDHIPPSASLKQAKEALGELSGLRRARISSLEKRISGIEKVRTLVRRLETIRGKWSEHLDLKSGDRDYVEAFRAFGLDLDTTDPKQCGSVLSRYAAAVEIASAFDDWALLRSLLYKGEPERWLRLIETARAADRDERRNALRALFGRWNKTDLQALHVPDALDTWPSASLQLLGMAWSVSGDRDKSVAVLQAAWRRFPNDFWTNLLLSHVSRNPATDLRKRPEEAVGYLRAAVGIRPDSSLAHSDLGGALWDQGKLTEAEAQYREAIRLEPGFAYAHDGLGLALKTKGKLDLAVAEYRKAIRLKPDLEHTHCNLGDALYEQGKLTEAEAEYRAAIRLKPDDVAAYTGLGNALLQGKPAEAEGPYRAAIRLKPDHAEAYTGLGAVLCDVKHDYLAAETVLRQAIHLNPGIARAHNNLGNALRGQGKSAEAEAEYRAAIRLKSDDSFPHNNLGNLLYDQGKLAEAEAEYRAAIRLKPDDAVPHNGLGNVLWSQRKLDLAVAKFGNAIRLKPDYAEAHYDLGYALYDQRKLAEAEGAFRKAIEINPGYADAYNGLGKALRAQGKLEDALTAFRKAGELAPKGSSLTLDMPACVRQVEFQITLHHRLPAILKGDEKPADAAEGSVAAQLGYDRSLYARAARLWTEALVESPALADDRQNSWRYDAACTAALAGCGQGKDVPPPDEAARGMLRGQARAWLQAELAAWTKRLEIEPARGRAQIRKTLPYWRQDPDLAGIRDPEALAKLPAEEQQGWRALWTDVDALLKKTQGP
jgi:serine/threonine-protein kinase